MLPNESPARPLRSRAVARKHSVFAHSRHARREAERREASETKQFVTRRSREKTHSEIEIPLFGLALGSRDLSSHILGVAR